MPITKSVLAALSTAAAAMTISGCVTNPETGERRISRTAIGGVLGAGAGYLLGDIVGGRRDRTERILGAGIGAVAGAGVGAYMDRQERRLREQTAGTGIEVDRQGDQLVLNMPGDVTFNTDSAVVQPQFQSTLDQVAGTLREYPNTYIDIYGHTDSRGSDVYNQGLSERRSVAVSSYLASRGVQSARLATRGYGETALKCPETSEDGLRCNRRVEIRIAPVTESDTRGAGR
jgi:outer membrane protein OmpA-like peptidoglycan-associated protein